MPIYEYEHVPGPAAGCRDPFEAIQPMAEAPLERCPACGLPCRRIISTFGVNAHGKQGLLSKSNLESHGFTQFTRRGKGHYEKTAGAGPLSITGDD